MQYKNLVIPIEKEFMIRYENKNFKLRYDLQEKVDECWEKFGSKFRRGKIYTVTSIKDTKSCTEFEVCNTDYAHYIYGIHNRINENVACKNLWAGIVLETSDDKYVLGEMAECTATEGELHISGGSVDAEDILDGFVDVEKTMIRELKEEFNIDITDEKMSEGYKAKFYKLPSKLEEYSFGILYKGKLKISSEEFRENYEKYMKYLKDTGGEIEFSSIYFVDKDKDKIKAFFEVYGDKSAEFNEDLFLQDIEIK